jgi:DnaJ-class molecular chaperone
MACGISDENDYYRILGVLRSAKPAEIAAAYHVLARQHHPDAGATDPDSLTKLKQINEAYEVLSDDARRRDYDQQHTVPQPPIASAAPAASSFPTGPSKVLFRTPPAQPQRRHKDIELVLPITPEEARWGGPCDLVLTVPQSCTVCDGRGDVHSEPCPVCHGAGQSREQRLLRIVLPGGVQNGMRIRVPRHAGTAGDLVLRLRIRPSW